MKTLSCIICLFIALLFSGAVYAGGPPKYMTDTIPEAVLPGILQGWGAMKGEGAPLDAKTTELIALAVAAQIPCQYCVHAHTANATKLGATEAELRHAVAVAGYVRLFSTSFQGMQYDLEAFKTEHDQRLSGKK